MKSLVYCLSFTFLLGFSAQTEDDDHGSGSGCSQGTDCTDIKTRSPDAVSGVYEIQPYGVKTPFKAYCEMQSDGGWTVFQKRSGGAVPFDRVWSAYENGFGNLTNDHWLGLQNMFSLTKNCSKKWTMRVDLWDHEGGTAFAEYENFLLSSGNMTYKLYVGTYRGDAGDGIRGILPHYNQNGFGFSTIDKDNDGCSPCLFGDIAENSCALSRRGGWWYSRCGSANLNGHWHPFGEHIGWRSGLYWKTWKGPAPYSFRATRMMIKSV